MKIDASQISGLVPSIARPSEGRPASGDKARVAPSHAPPLDSAPEGVVGTIRGVLSAEESRFIAGLFADHARKDQQGPASSTVYNFFGRAMPGSVSGARLDTRA